MSKRFLGDWLMDLESRYARTPDRCCVHPSTYPAAHPRVDTARRDTQPANRVRVGGAIVCELVRRHLSPKMLHRADQLIDNLLVQ